ncbi:P-loop containing nucleoside triphosphate hydrolase protein [Xylariomycetidae sp. FL0641]|nr:P-loop containing nucleoside triphosphate hydrolase protein [Xylariomycetidae sp. FL0641]
MGKRYVEIQQRAYGILVPFVVVSLTHRAVELASLRNECHTKNLDLRTQVTALQAELHSAIQRVNKEPRGIKDGLRIEHEGLITTLQDRVKEQARELEGYRSQLASGHADQGNHHLVELAQEASKHREELRQKQAEIGAMLNQALQEKQQNQHSQERRMREDTIAWTKQMEEIRSQSLTDLNKLVQFRSDQESSMKEQLKGYLGELSGSFKTDLEATLKLQVEKAELESRLRGIEGEERRLREANQALIEQKGQLESDKAAIGGRLKQKETDLENTNSRITGLKQQLNDHGVKLAQQERQFNLQKGKLERELEESGIRYANDLKAREGHISDLESHVRSLESEIKAFQDRQVSDQQTQTESQQSHDDTPLTHITSDELRELEYGKCKLEEEKGSLEEELQHIKSQNTELEGAKAKWEEKVGSLQSQNAALMTDKEEGERKLTKSQEEQAEQTAKITELQARIDAFEVQSNAATEEYRTKLQMEEGRRRELLERVHVLRGSIRTMCRIRPPDEREKDRLRFETETGPFHDKPANLKILWDANDLSGKPILQHMTFAFERVFLPTETNEDIFDEIKPAIRSFMNGKEVCIFCHGQSGSGKTYTINHQVNKHSLNDNPLDGIIPRTRYLLFQEMERLRNSGELAELGGCCYEVYNGDVTAMTGLEDYESKRMTFKPGIGTSWEVQEPLLTKLEDAMSFKRLYASAASKRATRATKLNKNSSRSHFILYLEFRGVKGGKEVFGRLNLVDLAGSENARRAGTAGIRAAIDETQAITSSLSDLGVAMKALREEDIPLSDKPSLNLAKLLSPCLLPGCMTIMLINIDLRDDTKAPGVDVPSIKSELDFGKAMQTIETSHNRIAEYDRKRKALREAVKDKSEDENTTSRRLLPSYSTVSDRTVIHTPTNVERERKRNLPKATSYK